MASPLEREALPIANSEGRLVVTITVDRVPEGLVVSTTLDGLLPADCEKESLILETETALLANLMNLREDATRIRSLISMQRNLVAPSDA